MVVSSLEILIFLALPRTSRPTSSRAEAHFFSDDDTAGEDSDVFEHGFAAVAKGGGFDGAQGQAGFELIDDEGRKSFSIDIIGNDEQGALRFFHHFFKDGNEVARIGEFFVGDEDEGVLILNSHLLCIGDKVGREIAFVELHPFDDIESRVDPFRFCNRDGPVFADFFHRFGDDSADLWVVIGGDGGDLLDFFRVADVGGKLVEGLVHFFDRFVDAALDAHRIGAGDHILHARL